MMVVGSDSGGGGGAVLVVVLFTTKSIHPNDLPDDNGSDRCPTRRVCARLYHIGSRGCVGTPTVREKDWIVLHSHTRTITHTLTHTHRTGTYTHIRMRVRVCVCVMW